MSTVARLGGVGPHPPAQPVSVVEKSRGNISLSLSIKTCMVDIGHIIMHNITYAFWPMYIVNAFSRLAWKVVGCSRGGDV